MFSAGKHNIVGKHRKQLLKIIDGIRNMGNVLPVPEIVQNEAKISGMQMLPSCAVDFVWSQGLHCSNQSVEPWYHRSTFLPGHEQGSADNHDVSSHFSGIKKQFKLMIKISTYIVIRTT